MHGNVGSEARASDVSTRVDILALTGLRCVAALMVVIGHASAQTGAVDSNTFSAILAPLAAGAMTLFFVLSGHVLWLNYAESFTRGNLKAALHRFAVARFARLYPLYICFLVLGAATNEWESIGSRLPDLLLYIPMMQAWLPAVGHETLALALPSISHGWSVSAEVFFYLLFPAIAFALVQCRVRTILMATLINFAIAAALGAYFITHLTAVASWVPALSTQDAIMWVSYISPYGHLFEFFAGCLSGALYLRLRSRPIGDMEHAWSTSLGVGSIVAYALTLWVFGATASSTPLTYIIIRAVPVIPLGYLMFAVSRYDGALSRIFGWWPLIAGGEASYSIYLLHPFILRCFVRGPAAHWSMMKLAEMVWLVAAIVLATCLMSWGTYIWIERPARKWLRGALGQNAADQVEPLQCQSP